MLARYYSFWKLLSSESDRNKRSSYNSRASFIKYFLFFCSSFLREKGLRLKTRVFEKYGGVFGVKKYLKVSRNERSKDLFSKKKCNMIQTNKKVVCYPETFV